MQRYLVVCGTADGHLEQLIPDFDVFVLVRRPNINDNLVRFLVYGYILHLRRSWFNCQDTTKIKTWRGWRQHLFIYLFIYSFIILHYHHIIIKSLIHPLATVNDTQFFVWAPTCSYAGQPTSGHAPSEATYSWISFPPKSGPGHHRTPQEQCIYKQP